MPEIVPAIIAKDFKDLKNKVKLVEPYVRTVQLDIMDGVFVSNSTWPYTNGGQSSVEDLEKLETNVALEAHLMVAKPEETLKEWSVTKVKRIIVHWEALENFRSQILNLAAVAYQSNKELGIALNSETPLEVLDHFVNKIDLMLLMSVNPGFAGQEFQPEVLSRIRQLRQRHPNVKIEVDGGINLENAKQLTEAGADFLAVGSTIFENQNIAGTIKKLKQIAAVD